MSVNNTTKLFADEHRARKRTNLKRMLNARSVAFIGGKAMSFSIDYCRQLGFTGEAWVVNPKYDEIGGIRCVPKISELPDTPDTAWIGVSTERSLDVVAQLASIGTPSAVCYTAGFSELGQHGLEQQLVEAAGDMALLGPNCMGFVNFLDGVGFVASSQGLKRPQRGVACIAQSGTIVGNMVMSDRSLPVSHMLSMGNQTVLDLADGIDAVTDDPRVDVIMLYVEGLKDARAFAEAVHRAHCADLPIVCLKGGASEAGREIALSHTGSLAGTPALYDAFFERLGIISVATFPELLEMSKLLALGDLPAGNRLMVETCSGTDSGYCADLAERHGVVLPQPGPAVQEKLRQVLPPIATPMNPLDVTMAQWADRDAQAKSLITLLEQPADAAALVINFPSHHENPTYEPAAQAMIDVRRVTNLPSYVISNLPEGLPLRIRDMLLSNGVVPLQGIEDAFSTLGRAARYAQRREQLGSVGGPECRLVGTGELIAPRMLDEITSKATLAANGVVVPPSRVVETPDEAVVACLELGFPVVVKGVGAVLAHKSELGAVATNLYEEAAVRQASSAIAMLPGVEQLLVETMITDAVAEVIVGIKRDSSLGLAVVIGAGGVLTELLNDTAHLILPVTEVEIRDAVATLKLSVLLEGYRGQPAGDVEALVRTVCAVTEYATAHAHELLELDVNPVLVRPRGCGAVAVDALIQLGCPS